MTDVVPVSTASGAHRSGRQAIREEVLRALVANRTPGFHFPGHFLGVQWHQFDGERAHLTLPAGPHIVDARGCVDIAALAVFADIALGTAARLPDDHHARQATVDLQLQLTGLAARGEISARARRRGSTTGTRLEYSLTEATIEADGRAVAQAFGKFVRLEPPSGVALAPLPWQRRDTPLIQRIEEEVLDPSERKVLHRCDEILEQAGESTPFVRAFWGGERRATASGAVRRLALGPHVANRVGHVQGGVLLAFAAATAADAAPTDMQLSGLSAWYLKPGRAGELVARSTIVHAGRTTALVRTQVTSGHESPVLEAVTQHVAVASNALLRS